MKTDVVILCNSRSIWEDTELRFTLRSVEKHIPDIGKVVVVNRRPAWLQGVETCQVSRVKDFTDEQYLEWMILTITHVFLLTNPVFIINGSFNLDGDLVQILSQDVGADLLMLLKDQFPKKSNFEKYDMETTTIEKIRAWLESDQDFNAGVLLYIEHGKNPSLKRLFAQKQATKFNKRKLDYELRKLIGYTEEKEEVKEISKARIAQISKRLKDRQKPIKKKKPAKKEKEVETEDLFNENPPVAQAPGKVVDLPIARSKENTNAILKKEWPVLTELEKKYFLNDESLFNEKRQLMLGNGDLYKEIVAVQAKLKAAKSDEERKTLLGELSQMEEAWDASWKSIDTFPEPGTSETSTEEKKEDPDAVAQAIKNEKRKNALRSNISRTEKKLEESPNNKKKGEWSHKLEGWKKELEELEAKQ